MYTDLATFDKSARTDFTGCSRPPPLLFFNSGIGGLSVLAPTLALLPNAPIVYVADSAGFPYGKRGEAEIASRVPALLGRLVERFRPRLAVIACNTASTIALDHVRSALDLPVVGTVPAIKPAAEISTSRVIGVLGLEATVRQPYVDDLAARFAADSPWSAMARPSWWSSPKPSSPARRSARRRSRPPRSRCSTPPKASKIDTVVLACTHFPLLGEELGTAFSAHCLCRWRARHRPPHRLADARTTVAAPNRRGGSHCSQSPAREPLLASPCGLMVLDEVQQL